MHVGPSQARHDEIAALLAQCAQADTVAFRKLYEQQSDALYAVALAITKQPTLAADALHDAFLQIWRNAGRCCVSAAAWALRDERRRSEHHAR